MPNTITMLQIDASSKPQTTVLQGLDLSQLPSLYRWHRLCLRVYGMLTWDIAQQVDAMVEAAQGVIKRSSRAALSDLLRDDLPVILALYAMEHFAENYASLSSVAQEILLPCFSLSYSKLHADKMQDPLKHLLARMDWFLDGEKGDPAEALSHVLTTALDGKLKDPAPLLEYLSKTLLPEMDRRMLVAWRSEFHSESISESI